MRLARPLLSLIATVLWAGPVVGQEATRTLVPVPFNASRPVNVQVSTDRSSLRIGEIVTICFQVSRPGYVTLWNIAADSRVARVFPNAFTPASATAMHVTEVTRRCVGHEGDAFRFQVVGPPGIDELYLLWTAEAALQPTATSYPDASRFAADLARVGQAARDRWATAKSAFDITDPAKPAAPAPPPSRPAPPAPAAPGPPPVAAAPAAPGPPPVAGPGVAERPKIYVLAMGADVKPLTKTNQDARMFVEAMRRRYAVPPENVRLYENVYKAQFKAGMDWLRERARPQDLAVIYFSGHGTQGRDRSGRSPDGRAEAFVPYELEVKTRPAAQDLVWSWEFVGWLNAIPAGTVLTVIDSCHSAGLYRSIEGAVLGAKEKYFLLPDDLDLDPVLPPATRSVGLVPLSSAKGTLLAAARRDQSALEGPAGSLFTLALVRVMTEGRTGTMADAFEAVARQVGRTTRNRQTPTLVGTEQAAERFGLDGSVGHRAR
jgi:hypothetical protein